MTFKDASTVSFLVSQGSIRDTIQADLHHGRTSWLGEKPELALARQAVIVDVHRQPLLPRSIRTAVAIPQPNTTMIQTHILPTLIQ